jgi:hypothetical protein
LPSGGFGLATPIFSPSVGALTFGSTPMPFDSRPVRLLGVRRKILDGRLAHEVSLRFALAGITDFVGEIRASVSRKH